MATIFHFPRPSPRSVALHVDALFYVSQQELIGAIQDAVKVSPGSIPAVLAMLQLLADQLTPETPLLPGWTAEDAAARRACFLAVIGVYQEGRAL